MTGALVGRGRDCDVFEDGPGRVLRRLPQHELRVGGQPGDLIAHLDRHPNNVVLTAGGPMVIDWSNAAIGVSGMDAANTWLTLTAGQPEGSAVMRTSVTAGRRFFVRRFLAATDRAAALRQLHAALDIRLRDPNLSTGERATMQALVDRVT